MLRRVAVPFSLLLVGVALLLSTRGAEYADLGGAFSPTFFPRIVLGAWILLAAFATVAEFSATQSPGESRLVAVLVVSVALLLYVNLLPVLGFFISSTLFSIVVLIATGQRKPLPLIGYSVALPAALVALFNHLLVMPLPVSPFAWWL